VALGERLHCLVVETPDQLESILAFIRERGSSRGAALALQVLRPLHPRSGQESPNGDVLARATDVVEAAEALRGAVQSLLGDVVIAGDLPAAWRIFATGYAGRIATRDGTLLSPEGVVTVGGRTQGDAAPLGRQQVIAELHAAVAAAQARRHEATAIRETALGRLAAGEEAIRSAQTQRGVAAAFLAEQLQRVARLEAEIARAAEEEAAHTAEIRTGTETLGRLQAECARREADLRHLEDEGHRLEAQTAERADDVRRLEAAREAASVEVTARRLALVQLDGTVEAIRARLSDRTTALAELDARRADLVATAGRTSAELAAIVLRRDEARAAYDRLLAAQAETKAEVERLIAERGRLRDDLAQRQADHAAAGEAVRAAEAAVHRTELRATQADAELAASAARLREQYGITLEDAATRRLEGPRDEGRQRLDDLHAALRDLGPVNLRAIDEHAAITARLDALRMHTRDLRDAEDVLRQAITHINAALRVRFRETFDEVNREFSRLFERLFEGGSGTLELVQDEPGAELGLEVVAQLPGKRRRPLVALSGGERSLVAITLIFAMLQVHPSPFCIFDEVEAALDDANTKRFTDLLRDLAQKTQVLIITHNKGTMAAADILYGVTMQEPGLSSIVSVRLVSPSSNGERPPQDAKARVGGPRDPHGEEPAPRSASAQRETVALPAE
jgi:chromosome segregation protein